MQADSGLDFNSFLAICPEIITALTGIAVMILDSILGRNDSKTKFTGYTALFGTVAAIAATVGLWNQRISPTFNNMIVTSQFRLSFSMIFLVVAAMTILLTIFWLEDEGLPSGEFFALIMFATTGMLLMSAANDLVMIFLGLETVSIFDLRAGRLQAHR